MTLLKLTAIGAAALSLSACITPESLETPPVKVKTPKGVVTCQLYSRNRISWDRSIDHPSSMTVPEADNVCRAEGARLIAEG